METGAGVPSPPAPVVPGPKAPGASTPKPPSPPGKPPATPAEKPGTERAPAAKADTDADTKAADAAADFELKLPEGIKADEALTEFKGVAKELGLKGETAQKVVDIFAKATKAAGEARMAEIAKIQSGWSEALKADKEFGGAELDANKQIAHKAFAKFGSPELAKFLEESRLGDHPELVRAFVRVGKAMSEDTLAGGRSGSAAGNPNAAYQQMYPTMFKES